MATIGGAGLAQQVQYTPPAGGAAKGAGTAAVATPAGPAETSKLSPAATQAAAYEKSSKAFDRFTGAFGKLGENDKKELGGQIGAKLTAATQEYEQKTGKKLTEAQSAELKWSTMASVSAEWAGNKAANSKGNADPAAARNLGDLYYGGTEYTKSRNEYLQAGGPIGQ